MRQNSNRFTVDGIEFSKLFLFPRILRSVTQAMHPPRLVIALLMVAALIAVGRTWDAFAEPTIHPDGFAAPAWQLDRTARSRAQTVLRGAIERYDVSEGYFDDIENLQAHEVRERVARAYRDQREIDAVGEEREGPLPGGQLMNDRAYMETIAAIDAVSPQRPFEALTNEVSGALAAVAQSVIRLEPGRAVDAARRLFIQTPIGLWRDARLFSIVYGFIALLVLSIGGGALCRMAACEIAGEERLRVRQAFAFAIGNWSKLLVTPLLPLGIAAGIGLLMLIPGLFMVAPVLDVIGGALYGVAVVLSFLLALLVLGYLLAAPMLLPAVACENCDAPDAQLRGYAYLLHKPLHLVGYGVVALVGLAAGYWIVSLLGATMLNFSAALARTFSDSSALVGAGGATMFDLDPTNPGPIHDSWHASATAGVISLWQRIVLDLVAAYVISYIFSACTMVYLLMRHACDGQDIEEIWRPGLAPSTLVPLPQTRVIRAEPGEDVDVDADAVAEDGGESGATVEDEDGGGSSGVGGGGKTAGESSSDKSREGQSESEKPRRTERMITGALRSAAAAQQHHGQDDDRGG